MEHDRKVRITTETKEKKKTVKENKWIKKRIE